MEKLKILLVEDEPFIARVIKDSLEQYGYVVCHATDGKKAYNIFQNNQFALCIVDVMLPHVDGFTFVKQIRARNTALPVIFLTAKATTADVITGYESGGNDYLRKPFSLEELMFRIKELLKRNTTGIDNALMEQPIGNYLFIPDKQLLQFKDELPITLSYRETQLLKMLTDKRNSLLQRKEVLLTLWGDDSFFNTRSMDVFIAKLRKHLSKDTAVQILNLRGEGFKLICP